jgi:hypothetical protein
VTSPWQPLARPLTAPEQRLLDYLVSFAACPELTAQAATASVAAVCTCGCSSIQLTSEGPDVPGTTIARLSPNDREDYVGIGCVWSDDEDDEDDDFEGEHEYGLFQVVVHVSTRLLELEIFHEEGEALPVPDPADLPDVELI